MTTYFAVDMTEINDIYGGPWCGAGSTPEEALAAAAELTNNTPEIMAKIVALPVSTRFGEIDVGYTYGRPLWVYNGVVMTQDEYEDWTNG